MSHPSTALFDKHRQLLDQAVQAVTERSHWTPYAEVPSPKTYGDAATETGRSAFSAYLGKPFPLQQTGCTRQLGAERSPWGPTLGITYPAGDPDVLLASAQEARVAWERAGARARTGVLLEALSRLHKRSFEIAHAVMMTTGQGWMMAFQAGGPHAQDRALEAIAWAWREQSAVPTETVWEKPQGRGEPLRMRKNYEIVGRGVALVIGCATFPTWNTYPGLFAALATGNPVLVKPHDNAILPAAITVAVLREVLAESGFDPHVAQLAVTARPEDTRYLATHEAVATVDFTGSSQFGQWLLENCKQAQVYAELSGVNHVVIESTGAYRAMLKNLAFSLSLYSGQMCTTPQAIIVPSEGISTDEGPKSFQQVSEDLGQAIAEFVGDPKIAQSVLGAIQSDATLRRIEEAPRLAEVVLPSRAVEHPDFPRARVHTPVLLRCDADNETAYMQERFGPITFVVKAQSAAAAIALAGRLAREHGALTAGLYSTRQEVVDAMVESSLRSNVALSINLTEGVFLNQSAAFSDYHGTGGNPAANASFADAAFVASRFRVVQRRSHV